MNIKAFGTQIQEQHHTLIRNIAKVIDEQATVNIYDINLCKPSVGINDIILILGREVATQMESCKCRYNIILPHIDLLIPTKENEQHRLKTYEILLEAKEIIQQLPEIKEVKILLDDVNKLEEDLKRNGTTSWTCILQDGKKARLTIEPEKSDADINLTFRELYALKACAETLGTREFKIAYNNENIKHDK